LNLVDPNTGSAWLVVWQPGTARSGSHVVDQGGKELATVGDTVSLGGGAYDATTVQSQLPSAIPSACQNGHYWLVTDVNVSSTPAAS
jgi:hypothetical protein